MSQFCQWECMREMANKANVSGQAQFFRASDDQVELQIVSAGGLLHYLADGKEVSVSDMAGEMAMQHQIQILRNTERVIEAVGVSEGTKNADMPATPHTVYDEHGVEQLRVSGLTKREYAEVHALAGALTKIFDAYEAVSYAQQAVSILMDEWAERDSNA